MAIGGSQTIRVRYIDLPTEGASEVDGIVSMEAERPTRHRSAGEIRWVNVPNLGRTGDGAIASLALNTPSIVPPLAGDTACVEYDFVTTSATSDALLHVYCLPTYRLQAGRGLRYGVSIDDGPIQVVDFSEDGGGSGEHGAAWNDRKMRNIALSSTSQPIDRPGKHTLRLWLVDPNVVVDKLALDLRDSAMRELRPNELGLAPTQRDSAAKSGR